MNPSSAPVQETDELIHRQPHERLSNLELHVLQRIACGQALPDVVRMLGTNLQTVQAYKSSILTKMGLTHEDAIVRYARFQKLVADDGL